MCDKALVKTTGGVEFYSCCHDGTPCHCQADETKCIKRECR